MQVNLLNFIDRAVAKTIDVPDSVFGLEPKLDVIYKVIHWQLAKRRLGTHKVKTRSEVKCSTRKIYKQKGTGQARHGAKSANQFRGGGISFGPHVRSYEYKLNKKVRKLGLSLSLSLKQQNNSLMFVDTFEGFSGKTADLSKIITTNESYLFVSNEFSDLHFRSSGNLHKIDLLKAEGLNVYDIMKHDVVIIDQSALKIIQDRLV